MVPPFQPQSTPPRILFRYDVSQQPTLTHPLITHENSHDTLYGEASHSPSLPLEEIEAASPNHVMLLFKGPYTSRVIAASLVVGLIIGLYLLWRPSSASTSEAPLDTVTTSTLVATTTVSNQNTTTSDTPGTSATIQVYIVGAIQHPGVYTLDSQARIYQLLQKAGGALSNANLATLNLAAKLSDGQEIYVLRVGETPIPSTSGPASTDSSTNVTTTPVAVAQVNINTAGADELEQQLSVSSKTAQTIINYRVQHGPYTSVDTLAQIVSDTIYKKIKDKVTVQ
jgi:competence protein ComEA